MQLMQLALGYVLQKTNSDAAKSAASENYIGDSFQIRTCQEEKHMLSESQHDRTQQSRQASFLGKPNFAKALLACLLLTPLSASAHHPLGGRLPETAMEGLLSGIGHPVIGIDHLAFIIAIGLLAAVGKRGLLIPVCFVAGSMAGVLLHLQLVTIPAAELFVAASVVLVGAFLILQRHINLHRSIILGCTAGIFHGYAYAEAIVGANMTTLASYITGLMLVQMGIAVATYLVTMRLMNDHSSASNRLMRMAGIAVASTGATFFALAAVA